MTNWEIKDGKLYKNGTLIRNPRAYGAASRRKFLDRERETDNRRPIHFSLDVPIPREYNKPMPGERKAAYRVNAWGMPIYNDQPLLPIEFYLARLRTFIQYAQTYTRISANEAEWLRQQLVAIFELVKESRGATKEEIRKLASERLLIPVKRGVYAKFLNLFADIAATPGWFAVSRDGASIDEAMAVNREAKHLWKHPRPDHVREGFGHFTPKRAHRRKKK